MNGPELIAWLDARAKWIDKEIRHGANLEHMSARYAECMYILAHARLLDSAAPDGLEAAQAAYLAFLEPPYDARRVRNQAVLCQLRDFIAKATGASAESVQNDFESRAVALVQA